MGGNFFVTKKSAVANGFLIILESCVFNICLRSPRSEYNDYISFLDLNSLEHLYVIDADNSMFSHFEKEIRSDYGNEIWNDICVIKNFLFILSRDKGIGILDISDIEGNVEKTKDGGFRIREEKIKYVKPKIFESFKSCYCDLKIIPYYSTNELIVEVEFFDKYQAVVMKAEELIALAEGKNQREK